ncbi:MAG TPA: hypothetical protein VF032_14550 [Thermoleophilaceae bacterium]
MTDIAQEPPVGLATPPPAPPFDRTQLQVVPVKALPAVGVVLAALVAVIATDSGWGLNFFHVVAGGLWTAIDLFVGFVVGPIMGRMSIPARMEFSTRFMPKMLLLMPTLVICTLAAGWQLGHHLGFTDSGWSHHGWIVASYIVVGVMSVIALAILEPANLAVLFELKKPRPNGELIGKLMKRFIYTAGITGAMQVATLIIMTRIASL